MALDGLSLDSVVQVAGGGPAEGADAPVASGAVAALAGRDQIRGPVVAALGMRLEVVERELCAVLDACPAVGTGQAVPEVNGKAGRLAAPVHSRPGLVPTRVVCGFVFHYTDIIQ